MSSHNKITLVGRLGTDPEVRTSQSGKQVARFRMATNTGYTDKENKWVQRTQWHTVKTWNQGLIEQVFPKYANKGAFVLVEGTLEYESYTAKGERHPRTVAVVMIDFNGSIKFLDKIDTSQGTPEPPCEDNGYPSDHDEDEVSF